jgi:DNA mismatch repair protein MutL
MGVIRELPPSVVNQIAAGEVVERPASVVKELLENAIDAGATRVELSIERGGKDLVRVADDGVGMTPEDLPLAFRPHATSKLATADDLHRVRTLGFRGEALAAIAEVARVRCQSRPAGSDAGAELTIEGGAAGDVRACGAPPGTVIEVRNLFYNTPVRRGFLKSDATETSHVVETFARVALAHPKVHLTLRSGGRVLHDLPPCPDARERVAAFFGRELADALIWVESVVDAVHLRGYVAHPGQSRSTTKGQYLFIGGRFVRDRSLGHALNEAYRGLLMVGRQPVVFLTLDLPPEEVDVNVHPTKIEVRFRDAHRIYSQMLSTVRQKFLGSDLHAKLQVPDALEAEAHAPVRVAAGADASDPADALSLWPAPADRQDVASWFQPSRPSPAPAPGRATPPEGTIGPPPEPDWVRRLPPVEPSGAFDEFGGAAEAPARPQTETPRPPPAIPDEPRPGRPGKVLQVHDSYLIAETDDGMVVIDQHALHERILYEELRGRLERGGIEAQRLLVPEPVELGAADAAAVLEHRAILARLGLEIEPFGGATVAVASMPAMLRHVPPERLLRDLADHFRGRSLPPTPEALLDSVLATIACKAAVKAGQRLSPEEIGVLLERRHLAANTHHCPHGRPAALVFTKAELERQFGRI